MNHIFTNIIENKYRERFKKTSKGDVFKAIFSEKIASLIAEVKLASPRYNYSQTLDYKDIIDKYLKDERVKAISILIDEKFFAGDIHRIEHIQKNTYKPTLFKEFIIEESQIDGASYYGYDAILLMKKILSLKQIEAFTKYSHTKNIFPIVEVDNKEDLESILNTPNTEFGIAINARNFDTMEVDTKIHFDMHEAYKELFSQRIVFAFSGISSFEEQEKYRGKYNGILTGTSLIEDFVKSKNGGHI